MSTHPLHADRATARPHVPQQLARGGSEPCERARTHVEVIRRARAYTVRLVAQHANDVVAQVLDAEVENHLPADRLEHAILRLDDDLPAVGDDAKLL